MNAVHIKRTLIALSICAVCFGLANAQVSSQRVAFDKATNTIELTNPRIAVSPNFTITAEKGFTKNNERNGTITLEGETQFIIDSTKGKAFGASYNPKSEALSAKSITFALHKPSTNLMSPMASVSYTCSGGTLYADGQSTGGSSACFGFTQIQCGGTGGNEVQIIRRKYACSQ